VVKSLFKGVDMSIFSGKVKILSNENLGFDICLLSFKLSKESNSYPGQFVEIRIDDSYSPLLRRPFSIFYQDKDKIKILYKIKGGGTKKLSQRKDNLDIIFPFGKAIKEYKGDKFLLVSGGIGFAPLYYLAERLIKDGKKVKFLIGTKTKEAQVYQDLLKDLKSNVEIATEDGSMGFKGLVTDLLKENIDEDDTIFISGPVLMLKEIVKMMKKKSNPYYVFFESHFACGMGSCFGCVIETEGGLKRICFDGPLFEGKVIKWDKI
jgi:dihydroorotate dehydrogenase electron transfer subunit